MAYDRRRTELTQRLQDAKDRLTEQEYQALKNGFDTYLAARQTLLEALPPIIENSSSSTVEQEKAWKGPFDAPFDGLDRGLAEALTNLTSRSDFALEFRTKILAEENRFIEALLETNVATRRDRIVINANELKKLTHDLERKWETIHRSNYDLLDRERGLAYRLRTQLEEAVRTSAELNRTIKEQFVSTGMSISQLAKSGAGSAIAGTVLSQIPGIRQAINATIGKLEEKGKVWLKTNDEVRGRIREYKDLLRSQAGGVFLIYSHARASTEEFLKVYSFDQVKPLYRDASDALDRWIGNLSTDAQKADAGELKEVLLRHLSNHLAATETAFNDFVYKHREKFFGPIGPDIRDQLKDTRAWEDIKRDLKYKGVEGLLRGWRDDANQFFAVDLNSAFARALEGFENLTSDEERAAKKELEAFREQVTRDLQARVKEMVQIIQDSEQFYRDATIEESLDRRPLDDALR